MSIWAQVAQEVQTFHAVDALAVLTLAGLEGILSVDNALVLAVLVRGLPKAQQKKALLYGMAGAFFFRIVALLAAAWLMHWQPVKIIGGVYLLYLSMNHMFFQFRKKDQPGKEKKTASFWRTVVAVEFTDIVFSIDSITTAVAMSRKLIIVWAGGILGIIALRLVSSVFIRMLESLPKLEDLAYQLVFFVGIKLTLEGCGVEIEHSAFWIMMGVIGVIGASLVYQDHTLRKDERARHRRLIAQVESGELSTRELFELDAVPSAVLKHLEKSGTLTFKHGKSNGSDRV